MHLDSAEVTCTPTDSNIRKKSNKEQIKMWFSPRSRKIRCVVNRSHAETKSSALSQDTSSVYDFFPSPPDEKPSKPTKRPTQKQSKKMKKKQLADINKKWSLEKPEQKRAEEKTPKQKCVTICSQPVVLCTQEPKSPEERSQQESVKKADSSSNTEDVAVPPQVESPVKKDNSEVMCSAEDSKEKNAAETLLSIANEVTPLKRGRKQSILQGTPQSKRARRSEGNIPGESGRQANGLEESLQGSPISPATDQTPVKISSSASKPTDTGMKTRSAALQAISSPSLSECPSTPSTSNTCSQLATALSPSVLRSPGVNPIARRNYKGETLLHVASIKVGPPSSSSAFIKRQCCFKNILEAS